MGVIASRLGFTGAELNTISKFSPTEFWEGVKYYQGTSSPIDACKKENGWSRAWLHHRGRNDHHYEYWTDDYDHGGKALVMPKKPAFELVCDYLGAGRAYMGKKFSYRAEYEWWRNKCSSNLLMDQSIKDFIGYVLFALFTAEVAVQRGRKISEEDKDFKSILEFGYEHCVETSKLRGILIDRSFKVDCTYCLLCFALFLRYLHCE